VNDDDRDLAVKLLRKEISRLGSKETASRVVNMAADIARLEARCARLHKALRRMRRRWLLSSLSWISGRLSDSAVRRNQALDEYLREWSAKYIGMLGCMDARESRGWGKCPSVERMEGRDETV
jgi:hypothetical protein